MDGRVCRGHSVLMILTSCRNKPKVLDDAGGSPNAALMVNVQQKGERGTNDPASCLHYPAQLVLFGRYAVTEPGSEAVC